MKANYSDLHVSWKVFLVVALLKKKKLFVVVFPVHFFLECFYFPDKQFFENTFLR